MSMALSMPDWAGMFRPDHSLIEMLLRGTITYWSIIVMMRLVLKRQAGSFGLGDMLLIVLIADASQNAMAGEYRSIPDGLVLVATLLGWDFALDWTMYHWKWLRDVMEPSPKLLIREGRLIRENLRKERITEEELRSQLRLRGIAGFEEVHEARMESGGQVSVLLRLGPGTGFPSACPQKNVPGSES
jgi:uncharacterized membrane protein YcaP (DUF421 family)